MLAYDEEYYLEEDKLGMTITAGSVLLDKNQSNLIGISIGGGGKYCPCLYVVQVFDNTAASHEGTLQSGDELTGVNNINVKGKSKTEVAQLIQRSQGTVSIQYNKLHPDPKQGKSLDIALKKVKHRLVETMSSSTADAFGLSRAILCNDSLVRKLDDLTAAEEKYSALIDHSKLMLKAFFDLIQVYKKFGDVFCSIGVRETQQSANEAFNQFGEAHRQMEKYGILMLKRLKPILGDLGTYLHKAIPDTRLTIKRYADVKFEYLSYCLKVKEMDDEEVQFGQLQEPLYRVETGNYEYRLVLRCRQDARASFARLRSDVMVKLELLDSKHVQHLTSQLTRLVSVLAGYHRDCQRLMHDKHWFPIELDLSGTTLYPQGGDQYQGEDCLADDDDDDDDDQILLCTEEATDALADCDVSGGGGAANQDLLSGALAGLDINTQGGGGVAGAGACDEVFGAASVSSSSSSSALLLTHSGSGGVKPHKPRIPNMSSGIATPTNQGLVQAMPMNPTILPGMNQGMVQSMNQAMAQSMNQGMAQSMNQGMAHSINQGMLQPMSPDSVITGVTEPVLPVDLNQTKPVHPANTIAPEVPSGISLLSQQLLSEPSLDKQLEGFMTPDKKNDSIASTGVLEPMQPTAATAGWSTTSSERDTSCLLSQATTAATNSDTKMKREEDKRDDLEDVSLLDAF